VSFPDPRTVSFEADGINYLNLQTLVELNSSFPGKRHNRRLMRTAAVAAAAPARHRTFLAAASAAGAPRDARS
jgi:hypothetical protein